MCNVITADNKEANCVHGFARSHTARYFCRFCQMNKNKAKTSTTENPALRRNRLNYNEDVLTNDLHETGIHEFSPLNKIPFFHVTESSAEDVSHTVEEGIVKYNISDALYFLIHDDKIFTIQQLNRRIKEFSYAPEEKSNKPHSILMEHLKNHKLRMTAAETATFIHNITFIIGDLVPHDNDAWQLILNTVKFFDFSYLPCYEEKDLIDWRENIEEMHSLYIEYCDDLKPHHHIATHFPSDTSRFGPLRYVRTIR